MGELEWGELLFHRPLHTPLTTPPEDGGLHLLSHQHLLFFFGGILEEVLWLGLRVVIGDEHAAELSSRVRGVES